MNREVRIDSESSTDVITVQQLKDWGKVPSGAEDHVIEQMIKSVRQLQEEWTGRSFIEKTLTANWRTLEGRIYIDLPYGPIRSITSIKRVYEDGTLSDALSEGTDYYVEGLDFQRVNLYTRWTSAGKIITGLRVTYTAGHGSGEGLVSLPEPIVDAMLRHVVTDYDQRDDLEVYQPVLYDWVKEALQPYKIDELWL
jgi:uncharacterized phiE125 gp8 family phage protein